MRGLTLWQPHAQLVALGVKPIETRSWSTRYRGPLVIHAAARPPVPGEIGAYSASHPRAPRDAPWSLWWFENGRNRPSGVGGRVNTPLPLGAIVATCTLVDVVPIRAARPKTMADSFVIDHDGRLTLFHGLDAARWERGWGQSFGAYAFPIEDQRPYGDFSPGRFAWLLADVKPVTPPVPCKGRQGLWTVPLDVVAQLGVAA